MEKICLICETKFDGRADAKTCSDKCKKALQRIKGTDTMEVAFPLSGTFVKGDSPELIERGQIVAGKKMEELKGTDLPTVTSDEPCKTSARQDDGSVTLNLEKDLGLDLKKDLGITAWTADGIFIRPEITVQQVQNIARLVHAKNGRPCPEFRQQGL